MRARIFATRLGAWLFSRAVSKALGLPRCDCPEHNPGVAVCHGRRPAQTCPCSSRDTPTLTCVFCTRRRAHVVRRPDGLAFAYFCDAVTDSLQDEVIDIDGTPVTIDTTTAVQLGVEWDAATPDDP